MRVKRFLCMLVLIASIAAAFPVNAFAAESQAAITPAAATVRLNTTAIKLLTGNKTTLKVRHYSGKITWNSSKKSVATVSDKGVVKGEKPGTATITAKLANGKKLRCKITVTNPAKITVTSVSPKSIKLAVTNKSTKTINYIKADIYQYNADGKRLSPIIGEIIVGPIRVGKSGPITISKYNSNGERVINPSVSKIKIVIREVKFRGGSIWTP